MTVCIAALCDVGGMPSIEGSPVPPKIVFCADRLISAGIQYEGGEPKVKKITEYCYIMQSSNDSLVSDLILENVKEKVNETKEIKKIKDIVEILRQECIAHKKERIENDILFKYNLSSEKFGTIPDSIHEQAIDEVGGYQYPLTFEFIVFGLEPSREVHIFTINQDAEYSLDDSRGFSVIGSGGALAFLEMTKHYYSRNFSAVIAIPRVYLAKRISERAEGVGRATDLGLIYFGGDTKGTQFEPTFLGFSHPNFLKKMDDAYDAIRNNERAELEKLSKTVFDMLVPPKATEETLATK